jgi:glycogen(starch) synthase
MTENPMQKNLNESPEEAAVSLPNSIAVGSAGDANPLWPARLLIVGSPFFLKRHRQLAAALRRRIKNVAELPISENPIMAKIAFLMRDGIAGRLRMPLRPCLKMRMQAFSKKTSTFIRISGVAARRISVCDPSPELVLQLFSMSSPAGGTGVPYAHYIDITMAMAKRAWPAWAPFESESEYDKWIELEGASYRGAERIFTFSEATRRSIIEDYGVAAERVDAVGAAGHFDEVAANERTYSGHAIIFNGSDFLRKGGDLVLAAFAIVRRRFPDASLTIVANNILTEGNGIRLTGTMTREDLFSLFDKTDVVLAPTRLDVMPGFVLEAMSRGVVPILSNADSMNEIITDGTEGYVVSPPTPELLAERLCGLFEDHALLRNLGTAARKRIERAWNWDAVAQAMVDSLARPLPVR